MSAPVTILDLPDQPTTPPPAGTYFETGGPEGSRRIPATPAAIGAATPADILRLIYQPYVDAFRAHNGDLVPSNAVIGVFISPGGANTNYFYANSTTGEYRAMTADRMATSLNPTEFVALSNDNVSRPVVFAVYPCNGDGSPAPAASLTSFAWDALGLVYLDLFGAPGLTSVGVGPSGAPYDYDPLTPEAVDAVLNSIPVAAHDNAGTMDLSGYSFTSASAAKRAALLAGGWTIIT